MTTKEIHPKAVFACRTCGISKTNRRDWCDLGCGRDYNEMFEVRRIDEFMTVYGLACVKAALEAAAKLIESKIYNYELDGHLQKIADKCRDINPQICLDELKEQHGKV